MNAIRRNIYVTQHGWIQPIDIVRGSKVEIELQLMDYDVPEAAIIKAYARGECRSTVYGSDCTNSGNVISLIPPNGFFATGHNKLQIEINGIIIPFSIDVVCEARISNAEDGLTPEQVQPLLERFFSATSKAETAAENAESSSQNAEEAARRAEESASQINENVEAANAAKAAAEESAARAGLSAESAATSEENAALSAEAAQQVAQKNGYFYFEIETGHLIETRTDNVSEDLNFKIEEGRLIAIYE